MKVNKKKKKQEVTFLQSVWMLILSYPVYALLVFVVWTAVMALIGILGIDIRTTVESFFLGPFGG